MLHIRVRRTVEGPSSGMTTFGDDIREAVEAREFRVCTDDLCEIAVDVRVDLVDTRPGIFATVFCGQFLLDASR
jgi:hypothetical protein